jgi:hypothetical protein
VQLGFQVKPEVGTTITTVLDSLYAFKDKVSQRYQKEQLAYILIHCGDKRGFDLLLESIDPRSIGYAVKFLEGTGTVGMPAVNKDRLYRIDAKPLLLYLPALQRFVLLAEHCGNIIKFLSNNTELKKILPHPDDLKKLKTSGPFYYLENGSFYLSNIESYFKVLLMCGTNEAIDLLFELANLADSFLIDGTNFDTVSLRRELKKASLLEITNPLGREFYNQLYAIRVKSFSKDNILDGLQNKHAVLRMLTLKGLSDADLPQGITWEEILKISLIDSSEVVKKLANELGNKKSLPLI